MLMSLLPFKNQVAHVPGGQLLRAVEQVIKSQTIEQAIQQTCSSERRQRILPTHVVVVLVIAMSFWSFDSIVDVFKNLIQGLSSLQIPLLIRLKAPTSSSISEARQRTGSAVMTRLFEMVAKPLATLLTPGAFLGGLRIMAVDGTVFDVTDTRENARVFGYPGSRPGTYPAFPKARLVFLVEAGTHLITDAFISPYRIGERKGALKLLRSVGPGMLLMWDRGLHSFKMVNAAIKQKGHFLGRVPAHVKFEVVKVLDDGSYLSWIAPDGKSLKLGATRIPIRVIEYILEEDGVEKVYRLITDLMDIKTFPALLLAQEYHQRLRLSFTGSLRVIRRAIPQFQQNIDNSTNLNIYISWLISEILDLEIPPPQGRTNPRVVKKTRSKYKSKKRCHRNNSTPRQLLSFEIFRKVS